MNETEILQKNIVAFGELFLKPSDTIRQNGVWNALYVHVFLGRNVVSAF